MVDSTPRPEPIEGETFAQEAARKHGLTVAEVK